jgi:hypothetical protein
MKHLARASWIGFILSELSTVGWTFVWPLTVDDDPASSVLRVGCVCFSLRTRPNEVGPDSR